MAWLYDDRLDAGRTLAALVESADLPPGPIVVALLRGGLPVARPVADRLGVALRALPVRRLSLSPAAPSPALSVPMPTFGALTRAQGHPVRVVDHDLLEALRIDEDRVEPMVRAAWAALADEEPPVAGLEMADACGRPVVLVDDGMVTGSTMRAATRAALELGASEVIAAVPVASERALVRVSALADLVVCPAVPEPMHAVATWYRAYPDIEDAELDALLRSGPSAASSLHHDPPLDATEGAHIERR